jgi:hypothetical protein
MFEVPENMVLRCDKWCRKISVCEVRLANCELLVLRCLSGSVRECVGKVGRRPGCEEMFVESKLGREQKREFWLKSRKRKLLQKGVGRPGDRW